MNGIQVGLGASATSGQRTDWADGVGLIASIGCAIHCAAMPFVVAYLPALGLSFLAEEAFHKWMAVGCFVIALAAFIPGLRKHGRFTPVTIGGIGLAMISVAAFGFAGECCAACRIHETRVVSNVAATCTEAGCPFCESENLSASTINARTASANQTESLQTTSSWVGGFAPWLTPLGGLVLVSAHLLNRRYGCLCGCCDRGAGKRAVR